MSVSWNNQGRDARAAVPLLGALVAAATIAGCGGGDGGDATGGSDGGGDPTGIDGGASPVADAAMSDARPDAGPPPERLWVVPWEVEVCPGQRVQMTASAFYENDVLTEVTAVSTWTSSDPEIAVVSDTGELLGVSSGTVTITAELQGATDTSAVTVVADEIDGLIIEPPTASVAAGLDQVFSAHTVTTCGQTVDVTEQAVWSSTVPTVAEVRAPGRVHTALRGSATIGASLDALSATATLSVTEAVAVRLSVEPALVSLPPQGCNAEPRALTAAVTLSDDRVIDVTATATWTSRDPDIATVVAPGQVEGGAAGGTEIRASHASNGVTVSGIAGATVASECP